VQAGALRKARKQRMFCERMLLPFGGARTLLSFLALNGSTLRCRRRNTKLCNLAGWPTSLHSRRKRYGSWFR
jgi:hypothetical protein